MGAAMHFRCRGFRCLPVGRCGKRPHGEIGEVQRKVFFPETWETSQFGIFIVVIIPHSFCNFFLGGRDSFLL